MEQKLEDPGQKPGVEYLRLDAVATWLRPGWVHYGFALDGKDGKKYGFEVRVKGNFEDATTKAIRRMDIINPFPPEPDAPGQPETPTEAPAKDEGPQSS